MGTITIVAGTSFVSVSCSLIFPRFLSPEAIEMDEFVRRLNASSITNES